MRTSPASTPSGGEESRGEDHGLRLSAPGSATTLLCDLENSLNHSVPLFPHLLSQFSRSVVSDSVTPWTTARQASLSITNSRSLLKLMSIEPVMPSNHLILCCPFSPGPQSFPASGSFQMSQLFTSGGQSMGVSASTSVILKIFRTDFL